MVDRSVIYVIGSYLFDKSHNILYKLARLKNPLERRSASIHHIKVLDLGLIGIFWAIFVSETSVGLFTLWLFTRGKWKNVQV